MFEWKIALGRRAVLTLLCRLSYASNSHIDRNTHLGQLYLHSTINSWKMISRISCTSHPLAEAFEISNNTFLSWNTIFMQGVLHLMPVLEVITFQDSKEISDCVWTLKKWKPLPNSNLWYKYPTMESFVGVTILKREDLAKRAPFPPTTCHWTL